MDEDQIVNALIQWCRKSEQISRDLGDTDGDVDIFPEAHYNHYGNRGVVDLYTLTGGYDGHVYEVKSETAVRNATGANEILRQFNRMLDFFPKGSSQPLPSSTLRFELCFTPTEYNAKHLIDNADVYREAVRARASGDVDLDVSSIICFRLPDPDNITPLIMFSENIDFREMAQEGGFSSYAESNPELYKLIRDPLQLFFERS